MAVVPLKYGRGLLFPVRITGAGDFAQGQEEDLVKSDLQLMHGVEVGELPWDMQAGASFYQFLDTGIDEVLEARIQIESKRVIRQDPRMVPSKLTVKQLDPSMIPSQLSANQTSLPTQNGIELDVIVQINTTAGNGPLLTDVEQSVTLR
jgi:hypothetical protein